MRPLRHAQGIASRTRMLLGSNEATTRPAYQPVSGLLDCVSSGQLKDDHRHVLEQASLLHPDIQLTLQLGLAFAATVRDRQAAALDLWLEQAAACDLRSLRGFARGLRCDYQAVKAVLTFPFSNCQTEGQVNRLTCIKRQGHGRADFDLLRLRVLLNDQQT